MQRRQSLVDNLYSFLDAYQKRFGFGNHFPPEESMPSYFKNMPPLRAILEESGNTTEFVGKLNVCYRHHSLKSGTYRLLLDMHDGERRRTIHSTFSEREKCYVFFDYFKGQQVNNDSFELKKTLRSLINLEVVDLNQYRKIIEKIAELEIICRKLTEGINLPGFNILVLKDRAKISCTDILDWDGKAEYYLAVCNDEEGASKEGVRLPISGSSEISMDGNRVSVYDPINQRRISLEALTDVLFFRERS